MRTLTILIPWLSLALGCAVGFSGTTEEEPHVPSAGTSDDATIEILEPAEGELVSTNLVRVSGTADVPMVMVAGEEVDVVDGRFAAALEMPDGPATIRVSSGGAMDAVHFVVDGGVPSVEIRLPGRGAFVEGPLLTVQGRVLDDDVSEVSVDGNIVPVREDGTFSYSAEVTPGAYHVRVSATDAAGHTGYAMTSALVGSFRSIDQLVERAAVLQVGEAGLREIGSGIGPLISPENLEPAILSHGHLSSGFWGHLDAEGYDHGAVDVTVDPGAGTLEVTVGVDDISLPLRADLTIGPDITGTAYADRAVASVTARLSSSGGRPIVTVVDTSVAIHGLLVDIDGLWSWLDRNVVTNLVRGRVSSELDALAAEMVPPALERAIERIPTTQVVQVGAKSVIVRGEVRSLVASDSGLRAMLDLGVNPAGEDPTYAGIPGFLTLDPGYPNIRAVADVRAQINLDLINAALFAAWSTGALEASLVAPDIGDSGPLNVRALGFFAPGIRGRAPSDAPVTVHVSPVLPAVIQPASDDETLVEGRIPDLAVSFTAEVDGSDVALFELAIGITAPIAVALEDDELRIDATRWTVHAESIGDDVGLPQGEDLDAFLMTLLGPAVEDVVFVDGLRIPQLYGFDATDLSLTLDDGYLVAEGRLTHAR